MGMGNGIGRMQKSVPAPPSLSNDLPVLQDLCIEAGPSAQLAPVSLSHAASSGLRALPRVRQPPTPTVAAEHFPWKRVPPDLQELVCSKVDFPTVKALRLTNTQFVKSGAKRFCVANIDTTNIDKMGSFFELSENIRAIRFKDPSNVNNENLADLVQILGDRRTQIEALDLSFCSGLNHTGFAHVYHMTGLQSVKLDYCRNLIEAGLPDLTNIPSLHSLSLQGWHGLKDVDLANLARKPSLQSLDLGDNTYFTDDGLASLAGMIDLQALSLKYANKITDVGLTAMTALRSLTLNDCHLLSDADLAFLAGMPAMQSLHLWCCTRVTAAGLVHLAGMTALQSLTLHGCENLADAGLASLAGITDMQSLDVHGCNQLTGAGFVDSLPAALCLATHSSDLQGKTGCRALAQHVFRGHWPMCVFNLAALAVSENHLLPACDFVLDGKFSRQTESVFSD